jgi:hypothetical protein
MVRPGSELIYDQMDEIESSLPTEETYDGDWEKSLLNKFKKLLLMIPVLVKSVWLRNICFSKVATTLFKFIDRFP